MNKGEVNQYTRKQPVTAVQWEGDLESEQKIAEFLGQKDLVTQHPDILQVRMKVIQGGELKEIDVDVNIGDYVCLAGEDYAVLPQEVFERIYQPVIQIGNARLEGVMIAPAGKGESQFEKAIRETAEGERPTQLNEQAYKKLINEDLAFLRRLPDTQERTHIEQVLLDSVKNKYVTMTIEKRDPVTPVDNLNKENFWNGVHTAYPKAVDHFCRWIDGYKLSNQWNEIFGADVKFHHLPWEMQFGIISKYFLSIGEIDEWVSAQESAESIAETFRNREQSL